MPKIFFVISSGQGWSLTLVKLVFKKKVDLSDIGAKNLVNLLYCWILRDIAMQWQFLIGTCRFKLLETPVVNQDRSNRFLCEMAKFIVFCSQERNLSFMLILMQFLGFGAKNQGGGGEGGLTLTGKIAEPAHFVF